MNMNLKCVMILFLDSLPYFGELVAHIFSLFLQGDYQWFQPSISFYTQEREIP